jgi:FkbM family methyltransferase
VLRQIVDVGAAKGLWTRECLEVFPETNYFLVEPLQENGNVLNGLQRVQPNVKVWLGALGAESGEGDFYVHEDQSSFFKSEYSESAASSTRTVVLRRLDSFLEDGTILPPNLIKADVQGFEIEVLKGAGKCLESTEMLLVEVSYRQIYEKAPLAHEVISYVCSNGFRIFDICTYAMRAFDGELAQSDILFAKANSRLFEHEGWGVK